MFCRKCGKKMSEDSRFCPACGAVSDSGEMNVSVSSNNSEWKKWGVLGCSLVSALGIFMPIIVANTYWELGYNRRFSILHFFGVLYPESDIYSLLKVGGLDEKSVILFVFLSVLIAVMATATTMVGVVLLFNMSECTTSVLTIGKIIAILGIIYPVLNAMFILIENRIYMQACPDEYMQFFEATAWEWILLIAAVVNLCICSSEQSRVMINES